MAAITNNPEAPLELQLQLAMPMLRQVLETQLISLFQRIEASAAASTKQHEITTMAIDRLTSKFDNHADNVRQAFESVAAIFGGRTPQAAAVTAVVGGLGGNPAPVEGGVGQGRYEDESGPARQELNADAVVEYTLNRKIISVEDVWREYDIGLSGSPSVRALNEKYQARWRKGVERMYYSKRLVIYEYIDGSPNKTNAVRDLDRYRVREKLSLDGLIKRLKEAKKNGVPLSILE